MGHAIRHSTRIGPVICPMHKQATSSAQRVLGNVIGLVEVLGHYIGPSAKWATSSGPVAE